MNTNTKLIIALFTSFFVLGCNKLDEKSFAYGNFETRDVLVPSEMNGILLKMNVHEGDELVPGQFIALIDTQQLVLKKNQLEANLAAVSAQIKQVNAEINVQQVALANLEKELKRFGNLFLEEAATKKQVDDLEGQIAMAKAQIAALESRKTSIYAEAEARDAMIDQVSDQISRSAILSPGAGQVLETYVEQGEMAVAGHPVIKMAGLEKLTLRVFIQGSQLSEVKLGDKVEVLYDQGNGLGKTDGTVAWISEEAEFTPKVIQTREERVNLVYAMKVVVPNNGELKIGMPGELRLKKQ